MTNLGGSRRGKGRESGDLDNGEIGGIKRGFVLGVGGKTAARLAKTVGKPERGGERSGERTSHSKGREPCAQLLSMIGKEIFFQGDCDNFKEEGGKSRKGEGNHKGNSPRSKRLANEMSADPWQRTKGRERGDEGKVEKAGNPRKQSFRWRFRGVVGSPRPGGRGDSKGKQKGGHGTTSSCGGDGGRVVEVQI